MSDFDTGFDPYQHLVKLTQHIEQLTLQHNRLVDDYMQLKARVKLLEQPVNPAPQQ